MINKEVALQIKNRAHEAIGKLDLIVAEIRGQSSDEDFRAIRRSVAVSMATIIDEILEPIYEQHPELDDLKSRP